MKIGIAGAGLLGRLIALKCLNEGHLVTLFDRDTREGKKSCGFVAAGMLSPFAECETAESEIFDLGMRSLKLWPDILKQLDAPAEFRENGSLVLAHPADRDELNYFMARLTTKLKPHHHPHLLESDVIATLESELNHFSHGYYLPIEAHINTRQLFHVLEQTLLKKNIAWHVNTQVNNVKPNTIKTDSNQFKFDWVFDCRGLGAQHELKQLRGVRGEIIFVHAPDVNISRPIRLMHPRYRIYIVPRENKQYVIGASEIESEDFSPMSVQSALELLSSAYSVHPGFAEARILEMNVNCRPAFNDNLPKVITEEGMTRINGLFRHGYLVAPALIEDVFCSTARLKSDILITENTNLVD